MKLQSEINLTAGNVIITANTGTKVTGSFQGTGTLTSGTSSVAGSFTNIPVQIV